MESNSVCNLTSDWQNQATAQQESDSFIMSMITDQIGQHRVLLSLNHKNWNFCEKKNSQVVKESENLH